MNYGFIGFGHLAQAIYQGLKNEEINFGYTSKSGGPDEIQSFDSIEELTSFADVILVCVKPQDLVPVLEDLRTSDLAKKMIVSPVAGKSIRFIEGYLGADITIARIMPNLAMAYGKSVTAYADNSEREITTRVKDDLMKLGKLVELSEKHFDLFTAIFGSGPAFLLKILEVFKEKTSELELPEAEMNELLGELVDGTMAYFKDGADKSIPELVDQIASKGGVTEAGLEVFEKNNLAGLLEEVLDEATSKSKGNVSQVS